MWTERRRPFADRPRVRSVALALAAGLTACHSPPPSLREPLPYSPNYSRVGGETSSGRHGVVRKGYDAAKTTTAGALVPDACLTPDVSEQALYLPPGCANNLNLQLMVEQESDLLHGRRTGPAMAAPVARAARRYIDEEPRPLGEQPAVETDTTQTLPN